MSERLVLPALLLFLAFVPFGSAPLHLGPLKVDNVIGLLLAALLGAFVLRAPQRVRIPIGLAVAGFTYFTVLFASVVFSTAPEYSASRYAVIAGYAFVALLVPHAFTARAVLIAQTLALAAVASASVILLAYATLGMSHWGRMTIPTYYPPSGGFEYFPEGWGSSADPNILGVGLLIGLLAFLAWAPRRWWRWPVAAYVVTAAALTGSRTAFAALALGLTMGLLLVAVPYLLARAPWLRVRLSQWSLTVVGGLTALTIAFWLFPAGLLLERFTAGDAVRAELAASAIDGWLASAGNFWLGAGFNLARTVNDPHNIYLTAVHDSGVLGLLALLALMTVLLLRTLRVASPVSRFWGVTILFFIAAAGMTYWHTKTFWVSVMLVLLIAAVDDKRHKVVARSGSKEGSLAITVRG